VTLRHNTLLRNLVIVGLIAAVLTAAGEGGSQVTSILFLILRIAFLVVLGWLGWTVWRQNRGTFRLMPLRSQLLLYGSAVGIVVLVATADLWASSSPLASLLFFAALAGCGYGLYRGWQESRRYYY
jgi:glucan phosphoethanolaminetransferase (alkaline phosphatase superfamily)